MVQAPPKPKTHFQLPARVLRRMRQAKIRAHFPEFNLRQAIVNNAKAGVQRIAGTVVLRGRNKSGLRARLV